jgi:DNA polymerase/3'-5' exonuclease PolX
MFPLCVASEIAEYFAQQIVGTCDRVQIVGSIRRRRMTVKDIDLVVIPRFADAGAQSLFGGTARENLLELRINQLYHKGRFTIESNGVKAKRLIWQLDDDAIPIDIHIGSHETWWTLLLIRTGSRQHNIAMACRAMERHMHLKSDGSGLFSPGGLPLPIHSEEEVFHHLGVEYRPPEARE